MYAFDSPCRQGGMGRLAAASLVSATVGAAAGAIGGAGLFGLLRAFGS